MSDLAAKIAGLPKQKQFVFVNVATTHRPYCRGDGAISLESQSKCLQYVDKIIPELLDQFDHGTHGVICADHGDCLGEDGKWGHGFVHRKVLDVPYAEFTL